MGFRILREKINSFLGFKRKLRFYLAGPISWVPDESYKQWRDMITTFLHSIGHEAVNPLLKYAVPAKEKMKVEEAIEREDISIAREYLRRRILNPDYELLAASDGVIAYVPNYSVGTSAEMGEAYRSGKPVYVVTPMPREQWSGWFVGLSTLIFQTWIELKEFLEKMALEGV